MYVPLRHKYRLNNTNWWCLVPNVADIWLLVKIDEIYVTSQHFGVMSRKLPTKQEITFLGVSLMWNNAAVCCGRILLKVFLLVSGMSCENPLRGNPRWCFLFSSCVVSIGMSRYWRVYIQASVLLHRGILRSLDQRMLCASSQVRWNCLWMPICVTPVPFAGWSCRWSLLMLGIIGGSTWVSHAMLQVLSIAMLGHFCYIPQCHIHRRLTIALLVVWQRLCCWLGPPW